MRYITNYCTIIFILGIINPQSKYRTKQQEDVDKGMNGKINGKTRKVREWIISYDIRLYDD